LLENKDIGEFNQCQNLLLGTDGLYQANTNNPNISEFTAYRILLSLYQAKTACMCFMTNFKRLRLIA
jgi:hypothetical protein